MLGASTTLLTEVGSDERGDEAVARLEAEGVRVVCARQSEHPTGAVGVSIDGPEPRYEIQGPAAWDEIRLSREAEQAVQTADVFCFGSLALRGARSRSTLEALLAIPRDDKPRVRLVDLNLRAPHFSRESILFCLGHADVIKLSESELAEIARLFDLSAPADFLIGRFSASLVCITRGAGGATAFTASRVGPIHQPAFPSRGDHPVGAGDAFAAALAVGLGAGLALSDCLESAARYAARVAELPGAMPKI